MPKTIFGGAHTHLVEVLVETRHDAGLSQTELAEKIGKNQRFVSLIERSQRRVDVVEFYVIAKALGADPAKLYAKVISRFRGRVEI